MQFLPLMGGTLFLEAQNIAMGAVLRAHGRTQAPMWVTAVQNLLNVVGNCLLLFGLLGLPRMGVMGVAISGVVSRLVAFGAFWVLVRRSTGVRVTAGDYFRFPVREIARILRIGLPSAGENLLWTGAFIVVTTFIARHGPEVARHPVLRDAGLDVGHPVRHLDGSWPPRSWWGATWARASSTRPTASPCTLSGSRS